MKYNFDEIIDRRNTNCIKYDFNEKRGKPLDVLPLWVADMDLPVPNGIRDSLLKTVQHSIFGYSESGDGYYDALKNWFSNNFNFNFEQEWVIQTPGVVFALSMALRAFTEEGDSVLIQPPVYYPFSELIKSNERKLITNPLVYSEGKYTIDFKDFEEKIVTNKVKLFLLCSPHNPVGRVWTKEELLKLGEICMKHNVLVVSDEIHCDFVNQGYKHHIFSNLAIEFLNRSVICTAPSKTFNIAGLQVSNIFIANPDLRDAFKREIEKTGYSQLNSFGLVACEAAYKSGQDWLNQLKAYLAENLNILRSFLKERLPQVKLVEPEGTYLIWLDLRELQLSQEKLDDLIINKGKLWLDSGTMFGLEGTGFQRINIACPKKVLLSALSRLEKAIVSIN